MSKSLSERLRKEADVLDRIQSFDGPYEAEEAAVDASKYREIAAALDAKDALLSEASEALRRLVDAKALSEVRSIVAGWNGENRPEGPYVERHPDRLGATLPKTNCGAVYALDDALQSARTLLSTLEAALQSQRKG